jgi:peroxiredoxin
MNSDNQSFDPSPASSSATSSGSGPGGLGFRLPLWAKALIILALVALASIGYFQSIVGQKPEISKPALAELDPGELAKRPVVKDFTLSDAEGKPVTLASLKGNVVILSFWASWCSPCITELPTFADLENKFQSRGLRIVPINIDEGDEGKTFAKEFWSRKKFPFPSYFDSTKNVAQQFEVEMLPSNFVLDRHGRLVFSSFGSNDWSSSESTDFIEGLLQESDKDPAPNSPVDDSQPDLGA